MHYALPFDVGLSSTMCSKSLRHAWFESTVRVKNTNHNVHAHRVYWWIPKSVLILHHRRRRRTRIESEITRSMIANERYVMEEMWDRCMTSKSLRPLIPIEIWDLSMTERPVLILLYSYCYFPVTSQYDSDTTIILRLLVIVTLWSNLVWGHAVMLSETFSDSIRSWIRFFLLKNADKKR